MVKILYSEIMIVCIMVLGIIFYNDMKSSRGPLMIGQKVFRLLLLANMGAMFFDTIGILYNGTFFQYSRSIVFIANSIYYSFHSVVGVLFLLYVDFSLYPDQKRFKARLPFYLLPMVVVYLLNFSNYWTGWYFTVNNENIYQISNKRTLGITEQEIIENITVVANKLIEQERNARKFIAKDTIDLEDIIYRSYGILVNCRKISLDESQKLISNVKFGTDLGILKELNDSKIQKLILFTKPASMQKYLGEQYEPLERDIKRAEVIAKIINEK